MKKACVTGGNGYLASALIKQLLENGYHVNATVRNPDDIAKVSHLKKLEEIGTLKLFQADLMVEGSVDEAVIGCDYVFHVAAPTNLMSDDPENELIRPAIQGTLNVLKSCLKAKTVERVVYTSSGSAVSVNQQKGTGYVLDEEAWSDVDYLMGEKPPTWGYIVSKTLAEKEALKFASENQMDLVTIVPTLIVGPGLSLEVPVSIHMALSLFTGDEMWINGLSAMETLSGSISMVHLKGYLNTSLAEIASFLTKQYPQYKVFIDVHDIPAKAKLSLSSKKLIQAGYEFNYKMEEIFDTAIEYGKSKGMLPKQDHS
ncbi:hypothetical protein J5N97_016767 [Dioscorea zingiberensis]|uniref:NAD-dependent epimerase/dehydratase domain-containing protein n=1 Tax=Dioscorea zingiberensis TaxID=325984 RepID=A0A9D5CLR7_9LILI|nr:hypothetical protein J5N97_016767 [Dioscorea zingiberensis]